MGSGAAEHIPTQIASLRKGNLITVKANKPKYPSLINNLVFWLVIFLLIKNLIYLS
jgi:hypothetical protein